jgi:hypothetical protein
VRHGRLLSWASLGTLFVGVAAAIWLATATSGPHVRQIATVPTNIHGVGGRSCSLSPGTPSITLSDTDPERTLAVSVGTRFTVLVPPAFEAATDVTFNSGNANPVKIVHRVALRKVCTLLLPNNGRRTILMALSPGQVGLFATVTPATNLEMPAWLGEVIVTNAS